MKYRNRKKLIVVANKALTLLMKTAEIIDEGLYEISFEKLKRESHYLEGDPRRYSNRIHGLERQGYIKINRNTKSVELTTKGRIKILENSNNNKTDGKWRFLSWDIPEELSTKRQQFCRSIRRIGFKQIQKSLWASPFIRSDEVYLVMDELKIRKYVAFIISNQTDIGGYLQKLFNTELK